MFWGLVLEPGKRYSTTVDKSFHVSTAALDCSSVKSDAEILSVILECDGQENILCNLSKQRKLLQCHLDLNFMTGDKVSFEVKGKGIIHLSGYLVPDDDDYLNMYDGKDAGEEEDEKDEDEDSDEEDEDEEEEETGVPPLKKKKMSADIAAESDDDEEDEDEDDSDEEEISDDEEEEEEEDEEMSDSDEEETKVTKTKKQQKTPQSPTKKQQMPNKQTPKHQQSANKQNLNTPLLNGSSSNELQSGKKNKKKGQSQTPNQKGQSQTPNQKGQSQTPNQKGQSQTPNQKGQSQTPNQKGQSQTPNQNNAKAKNQKTPGSEAESPQNKKTLIGGVMIKDIKEGDGPVAKSGQMVSVYYQGRLKANNKMFDECKKSGPPFKFRLGKGEVIKAWDVAVSGMKVGGVRTITCPPNMAYGQKGSPPQIPPNSALVFHVELKSVN